MPPPQRMRGDLGLNSKVEGRRKPEGRKPETRRPKVEGRKKAEIRRSKAETNPNRPRPRVSSDFGLRPSFGLRVSVFGLQSPRPRRRSSSFKATRQGSRANSVARAQESPDCSGVGQTSGLTVHGASGSVVLGLGKLRARGPANRQTGGLPHAST